MKKVAFFILSLLILSTFSKARAQTEAELRLQRQEAFRTMVAGQPMQAANDLLRVVRALPAKDPNIFDIACGNLQLLMCDINLLMDDQMRQEFFTKTLDIKNREVDALIVTLHEASLPMSPPELKDFLSQLWKFSESSNDFIAVVALYLLANPYYSEETKGDIDASDAMASRYPNIEAARSVLALPIYHNSNRLAVAGEWCRAYLGKANKPGAARHRETTLAETSVMAQDPFVAKIEPVLDDLREDATKRMGIEEILTLLKEEPDWHNRYGYLRMLEPEMKAPPGGDVAQGFWNVIEPALKTFANREPLTPDVYRARVMLCHVACGARDFDKAGYWAERVLTEQDRIAESPERIAYEEAIDTFRGYATALVDNGESEKGAAAYERLASFFPNSALAVECLDLASRVKQAPK